MTTPRRLAACAIAALLLAAAVVGISAPAQAAVSSGYYKPSYTSTIYYVSGGDAQPVSGAQWAAAGRPAPRPAPTSYVKYPWSPTLYAVTFWGDSQSQWMWHALTGQEWAAAGYPTARDAGYIAGSYFYKWGTSSELFVLGADGVHHKLTYAEWAASGYRSPHDRVNEGFIKLSWAAPIARMTNLSTGAGAPISYSDWADEAFPTPQVLTRVAGDQFYTNDGSPTVYYAGPTMNRAITYPEWAAAGYPQPHGGGIDTTPVTPPTTAPLLGLVWASGQQGYGQVKPSTVFNGGDPTGLVEDITWTSYGGDKAVGTGRAVYVGPDQTTADGIMEPAIIVASDLGSCLGKRAYLNVTWYFPQHGETWDPSESYPICDDATAFEKNR